VQVGVLVGVFLLVLKLSGRHPGTYMCTQR